MGGGSWKAEAFCSYSASTGRTVSLDGLASCQNMFTHQRLDKSLDPYKVIRECCDSEEHPNTIPVILALDVTGSMGDACKKVAQSLNVIMTELYSKYKDIEFMIMAIGDLAYDESPIQASQFESDIRIAEQTDKIYFEAGGGGNSYESYTAAWYFALNNTNLHCWTRNKKGIIITLGDEPLNPYLPKEGLKRCLGCTLQEDVETKDLYDQVIQKFDVYHIAINDSDTSFKRYEDQIKQSWGNILGTNLKISNLDQLPTTIINCISQSMTIPQSISDQVVSESIPVITW